MTPSAPLVVGRPVEQDSTDHVPLGLLPVFLVVAAAPFAVLAATRPSLAVAGALAIAVIVLCVFRPDIALLLLVASAPLESGLLLSDNGVFSATKAAGALAFGSFAVFALVTKRPIIFDRSHAILLLLLAWAALSTVQARVPHDAIVASTRYASFAALYTVITQFAGDHRLYRRVVGVLTAASAFAAFQALQNFLSGETRVAAPLSGEPNDLAFVLATTLPLSVWLLVSSRAWWRLLTAAAIGVIALGLLFSFSRSAILGVVIGVAFYTVTERRHLRLLAAVGMMAVAIVFVFIQANPELTADAFGAKQRIGEANVTSRFVTWAGAVDLATRHPVLGIGPGNFRHYYYEVTGNPVGTRRLDVTHHGYLDMASELGLPGLFLFMAFIVVILWRMSVATRRGLGPPELAALVRASFVIVLFALLSHSQQYLAPLWVNAGLATAVWRGSPRAATSTP